MKKLLICLIVVMMVVLFVGCSANFKSIRKGLMKDDSSAVLYCKVADDGSYMTLDTNCTDTEGIFDEEAFEAIKATNEKLGLPDSVLEKMESTSGLDGTQTAEHKGIIVSWSYHPDYGLEVMYEKAN